MSKPEKLRVVLIGKTTNLVNSAKKTIERHLPETMELIATPGLCELNKDKEVVLSEIATSIFKSDSNSIRHVFLYVQQWECFSTLEEDQIKLFLKMFGEKSMSYFLPVIAKEELPEEKRKKGLNFFKEYGFKSEKICVMDIDDDDDDDDDVDDNASDKIKEQVGELVREITKMDNKGTCYTVDMFKDAQEDLAKEMAGSKIQDNKESVLSSLTSELTKVLGKKIVDIVLKANIWLPQEFRDLFKSVAQVVHESM